MAYDPRTYAMYRSMEHRKQWLEDAVEHSLLYKNTLDVCQQIADLLPTQDQYDAWWASTPDDDEGFYRDAVKKLAELRMVGREPEDKLFASCIQDTPIS